MLNGHWQFCNEMAIRIDFMDFILDSIVHIKTYMMQGSIQNTDVGVIEIVKIKKIEFGKTVNETFLPCPVLIFKIS